MPIGTGVFNGCSLDGREGQIESALLYLEGFLANPTGFDMCRRYQMPDNVEPFQPIDGSHRCPGGARDPGL